jgi:Prokaryotic membrane lipoprotein lipid attachment site
MKRILLATFAALLLAGCVTQKIDWPARVGNYTHDQAVMEFGPPDKSAKLTDGTTVAEWMVRSGQTVVAPEPYFVPPGCYFGPLTPMYSSTYVPAEFLRLTFDTDNKLRTWKYLAR